MEREYLPPSAAPNTTPAPPPHVDDVRARPILAFGAGLATAVVLTAVLMWGVYVLTDRYVRSGIEGPPMPARGQEIRIPPRPRLLGGMGEQYQPQDFTTDPAIQEELKRDAALNFERERPERLGELYRSVKRRELETFGLAAPGEYRVPIERAKSLLLTRPDPLAPVELGQLPPTLEAAPPVAVEPPPPMGPPPGGLQEGRPHPEELLRPIHFSQPQYGPMRSRAANDTSPPLALEGVRLDQRLGTALPADLVLHDEQGRPSRLGGLFGHRPIVLAFAYFDCPMLCPQLLTGLASALDSMPLQAGRDYEVVVVSFDPRDHLRPERAAARKAALVGNAAGWHFLTAERSVIDHLTRVAGFRFRWDPGSEQYAHPAGAIVATPDGLLSRYLYGVSFSSRDFRLALVEASAGRIGSPVDDLLLYCFRYDPASGRYTAVVMNILRLAAVLTLATGGLGLFLWKRRTERLAARRDGVPHA